VTDGQGQPGSGNASRAQPSGSPTPVAVLDPIWRLQRSTTLALILSPVGILLLSVARVLIVADYNAATAAAIVTSGGYINALLGSVVPIVPILMPYVALVLLFFKRFLLGIVALVVTALISPAAVSGAQAYVIAKRDLRLISHSSSIIVWIVELVVIGIVLLIYVILAGPSALVTSVGTISSLALALYVLQIYSFPNIASSYSELIRQPWMPAERITLSSGPPVIGYVLASTDTSLEVLLNSNRSIIFYPNGTVVREQICQVNSAPTRTRPLVTFLPPNAGIPDCANSMRNPLDNSTPSNSHYVFSTRGGNWRSGTIQSAGLARWGTGHAGR
jgi:hypothetical protein